MLGEWISLIPLVRDHFGRLHVEVLGVSETNHGPNSLVVSVHPYRYHVNLRISNGNLPPVGIRQMRLSVDGVDYEWVRDNFQAIQTGEVRETCVIFPSNKPVPSPQTYVLTITDSRGRVQKISGVADAP